MRVVADRIQNEPVLVLGVVQAGVALVAAFGLDLSGDQMGALVAFSAALLSVIARTRVTPNRRVPVEPEPNVQRESPPA